MSKILPLCTKIHKRPYLEPKYCERLSICRKCWGSKKDITISMSDWHFEICNWKKYSMSLYFIYPCHSQDHGLELNFDIHVDYDLWIELCLDLCHYIVLDIDQNADLDFNTDFNLSLDISLTFSVTLTMTFALTFTLTLILVFALALTSTGNLLWPWT